MGNNVSTNKSSKTQGSTIAITNYQQDNVLFDTLHSSSNKGAPSLCQGSLCQGSLMFPKPAGCPYKSTNESEIKDFFNQYFSENNISEKTKAQRINEILREKSKKGSFTLTADELEFAARTAWRNAPRCIGRIQWNKLKLFDARKVGSTRDMFECICTHIEYGTNGGNIRSAITVFPPKDSGKVCRIWNSQYISYAGFRNADGSILGDPARAEFTDICLKLGWKPMRKRFEVLPLVLQYGDEVKWYEIPKHLVLEVPISHPRYPKLEKLNLQWYAVPGVSNMNLKCADQVYPGCAFNGWYMSTEVVRDLCDTQRYNLLKEIAESFDLDTNKPAVFWKDTAAVELNVAVVHSFQANQVTIADHHSASDSFMKHMEYEQKKRGGCPADWVWITPPLGGSLTSVFHQEMLNYTLQPSFDYQANPWMEGNWRAKMALIREKKLTFRATARAALQCVRMINHIKRLRKTCTILYATETGQSERFACQLKSMLQDLGLNTKVITMNEYDVSSLSTEQLLLVVASTFGNGDAPENGNEFEGRIEALFTQKVNLLVTLPRFGVFGLGSSSYPNFCAFGVKIDNLLESYGMQRLVSLGKGDDQGDQQRQFKMWAHSVCENLSRVLGISVKEKSSLQDDPQSDVIEYKLVRAATDLGLKGGLKRAHHKEVLECKIISVDSLVKTDSSQKTIIVKLHHAGAMYSPGDHAAVYPSNSPEDVRTLCDHIAFEDEQMKLNTVVELLPHNQGAMSKLPPVSLVTALTHYLNIETLPKQDDLEHLVHVCSCSEEDRQKLLQLTTNSDAYNTWAELRPTWAELVKEYDSIKIPATFIFTKLPPMLPRYYSISSCSTVFPNEIHLTVSVLQYSLKSQGQTKHKKGLCSNWLMNLQKDSSVYLHIRRNPSFHLPSDVKTNVVMIGAGSGLAPFRGFWQQNLWHHASFGKTADGRFLYLFQGMRSGASLLFDDEIQMVKSLGVIDFEVTAFSRDVNHKKCYVQDKLKEYSDMLCELILQNNTHIYVCGDVKMANEVQKVLCTLLQQSGGNNSKSDPIAVLKQSGRYHEDVYSILVF